MMYKFTTKAAGDVIMMGPAGDQMLKTMGKEPASKGIIQALQLPAAISAIEHAIGADEAASPDTGTASEVEGRTPSEEAVSLRQRAWPLLEMLRQASRKGEDIVWGV